MPVVLPLISTPTTMTVELLLQLLVEQVPVRLEDTTTSTGMHFQEISSWLPYFFLFFSFFLVLNAKEGERSEEMGGSNSFR